MLAVSEAGSNGLLVTGMDFLPEWISHQIKSTGFTCTSDVSEEALSQRVKGFEGILFLQTTSHYKITRKIIESGEKLRFIQTAGVGYEQIDLEAATDNGVAVMNLPSATTTSVAEHAVSLILACAKNIVKSDRIIRSGGWRTMDFGVELQSKTLGIIGFGRIGKEIANIMRAFEMKILVYSPHLTEQAAGEMGCRKVDLQTLLRESDVISISAPLTSETRKMVGEDEFKLMKKSAILVNTARGEIVDEAALIRALRNGRISSAGLDVFEHEPIEKDNPLLALDNVVLTPHNAVMNQDAMGRLMNQVGIQVENALKGIYENVVNPGVLNKLKNGRPRK